jgi:hypothetical protein
LFHFQILTFPNFQLEIMFIAQQKRKENIAEYILYMWQIEDLIRAFKLDLDAIAVNIVDKTIYGEDEKKQLYDWYDSLIGMMRLEGVQEKGHLQIVKNGLSDVIGLHYALLKSHKHSDYSALFYSMLPTIGILKQRQENAETEDIEACFVFLYGVLLLRLQKKEISGETGSVLQQVSKLLALLSQKYKLYLNDELELEDSEF